MRMISLAFAVCLAVLIGVSAAQTAVGTLTGTVKDPGGAAMAGVTVRIAAKGGPPRTVLTDARGEFRFQGLATGDYTLTATLTGFTPFTTVVSVTAKPARVAIVLQVAAVSEQQRAAAAAPKVEADRSRQKFTGFVDSMAPPAAMAPAPLWPGRRYPSPPFNTETYDRI